MTRGPSNESPVNELSPQGRMPPAMLALMAATASAGILVVLLDRHEIVRVLGLTDWSSILLAMAATAAAYFALSMALVATGELLGIRSPRAPLLRAAFISEVLNHVVSMGGVAGYSLRTAVMTRNGVRAGDVLAMSLLHSYLNNAVLALLLVTGVTLLTLHTELSAPARAAAILLGGTSAGFTILSTAGLLSRRVRTPLLRIARALVVRLPEGWHENMLHTLGDLEAALAQGADGVRRRPIRAIPPATFILAHWMLAILAFRFCFAAFGDPIALTRLVSGFAIGLSAGFVAFVPGGIGVQEGALVGTYALLGVPAEQAALAAILFRVVFTFMPYLVSLPLYLDAARAGPALRE